MISSYSKKIHENTSSLAPKLPYITGWSGARLALDQWKLDTPHRRQPQSGSLQFVDGYCGPFRTQESQEVQYSTVHHSNMPAIIFFLILLTRSISIGPRFKKSRAAWDFGYHWSPTSSDSPAKKLCTFHALIAQKPILQTTLPMMRSRPHPPNLPPSCQCWFFTVVGFLWLCPSSRPTKTSEPPV